MTRKNRARYGLSRTYKVSATAKALRGAMIAALATAGASQSALAADECIVLGQNIQCVGATNDTIDNSELEYPNAPFDLTTVTFATSFNSVVGNWNGVDISVGGNDDLRVNNLGSIFVVDDHQDSGDIGNTLYGVRADAIDGGISFNNSDSGTVLIDIDQNNEWWDGDSWNWEWNGAAVGVDLYGDDFATVTNAGLISAGNQTWDNNNRSDATALRVDSRGDVTVVNQAFGSIYAYSTDGDAIAVDLWSDYGDIAVVNNANIAANGDDWTVGVLAEADADISVNNNFGAEIRVYSEFGDATGVLARAWNDGNVTIENAGLVQAIGDNWATGVYAETIGGDIAVGNTGDINVRAYDNDATGIGAETKYGAVNVQNDASIDVWGYDQANGVTVANFTGYGDVTVGNTGNIQVRQEGDFNNNNGPFDLFGDAIGIGVFQNIVGTYNGPNPFMGYGDVSIGNSGTIGVWADGGTATGVGVVSFGGDVAVDNSGYGDIWSRSVRDDAFGVAVSTFAADITVTNGVYAEMFVTAEGWNSGYGDAIGVGASAKYGAVDVDNAGEIFVSSWNDDAFGIQAYASGSGMGPFSVGLLPGDIHVGNTGLVDVFGDESATGVLTNSIDGTTVVDNTGVINVDADEYNATGIRSVSSGDYNGDITINNTALRNANGDLIGGIIDVYTHSWSYNGFNNTEAVGIDVRSEGYGDITVTNSGRIGVYSEGDQNGDAWGIRAMANDQGSEYAGAITVTNSGLIDVYADEDSWGVRVDTYGTGGDITVTNSGTIDVSVDDDDAFGIDAATYYGYAGITVTNSGNILVVGDDNATGIDGSVNGYGDLIVGNSGLIDVFARGDDAYGMELGLDAEFGDYVLTVTNTGVVLAESDYGDAFGIKAETYADGDLTITNTAVLDGYGDLIGGVINAESQGSDADGIHAYHYGNGDIVVSNSGLISSETHSGYGDLALGIDMRHHGAGDIRLTNTGTIEAIASVSGNAWGMHANTMDGYGDISISNSGLVRAYADASVNGITASAGHDIHVDNSGTIRAAGNEFAFGIDIDARRNSSVSVVNYAEGVISVDSDDNIAGGIDVYVNMQGLSNDGASINIANAGDIIVEANGDASGIGAFIETGSRYVETQGFVCANVAGCSGLNGYVGNGGWVITQNAYWADGEGAVPVTVSNSGDIAVASWNGDAEGIVVRMDNGSYGELASVTNSGTINVYSEDDRAYGVNVFNDFGDTVIANTADGAIYAEGWNDAYGISARGIDGDITVTNAGLVVATAGSDYAVGIYAETNGSGDISVSNAADAYVVAYGSDRAVGIGAWNYDDGQVSVVNAGDVYAYSNGWTVGIAAQSDNDSVSVTNTVDGRVIAVTDDGDAYGIDVWTGGSANVANAGVISVYSENSWATGMYVEAWDDAGITVTQAATGSIVVESAYGDNRASGMNLYSDAGAISVTTAGSISAVSGGYDGYAMGIYADSNSGDITVTNSAAVTANANGDYGDAIGIWTITEGGDISVSNSGNVFANANAAYYGWSVGIYTENETGATTIANSGNVRATSDGVNDAWAIYHRGNSVSITNAAAGNIFGVIRTDDAADSFTNSGDWYATEGNSYVSDFGAGNDAIVNNTGARIFMDDSVIDLGYAEGGVNSFMNNGKVFVRGADNEIDMGGATSVFTNNGASLHFEDGAANDALTIFGDFAGTGHIVVDANGTSMLADRLYIDGDVISNTANVIDVYLTRNPTLEQITDGVEIDIVQVSGTSLAANFNLGIVDVDAEDTLYTVSHTLNKHINVSGSNDLFALGFEISGLSQSGVAVSSIAPAVQNLWHLGSGTMFQRQGSAGGNAAATGSAVKGFLNSADGGQVADYQGASGAWVRMFADNGGLTPDMGRDNFGTGGVQQFDLSSSGIEFGAGYAFNDQWTAGLLGGVSEASLKPEVGGRTKVDADTVGAYLTYTPGNGFYLDLSYRAMGFDGQGNGNGFRFEGDADGYSVELGYGFKTSGGLVIEPQFQYSAMDVNLDQVEYFDGDFDLTDGDSSQVRGSIALRKTYQSGAGEWTPFASVGVVNETNASNDYVIGGILTGNVDTSGNSTLVEAGATAHYGNLVFSGGVNWKDGGAYDSLFGGQVSVRFTW
ncbi:hypothetical protein GCM10010960_05150 [Arenimonas maotaiensis]|uniref:Autotransporter domain-containing protein n=1 Tax=Arenimonas maotaiensis TaxID=1446479 RepID=A0A917CGZ2_9GAMM|nr:hypothetical protein [Arenimonas maotaiensis]GGF86107.1 hypothetical protein GCM10010960_05150 [Arenimonas maotaiensis]